MDNINIARAVKENRSVRFAYYRDGALWYVTEFDEVFPVPVSDLGKATANCTEKAILMMRYMRQHNAQLTQARREVSGNNER